MICSPFLIRVNPCNSRNSRSADEVGVPEQWATGNRQQATHGFATTSNLNILSNSLVQW